MRRMVDPGGVRRTLVQMALTCLALFCVFTVNEAAVEQMEPLPPAVSAAAEVVDAAEEMREMPIIMYHAVLKDTGKWGKYVISPDTLASDLDYLCARGYETVTAAQLVDYVNGQGELPEKPVMITFDDGHFNNYLYAGPLLRERGMRAVISVIGVETERYTETGQENAYWSYLSTGRLNEMVADGTFEVQNHSYDLHANDRGRKGCARRRGEDEGEYRAMLMRDTEQTQMLLISSGISTPLCYTYPFGIYSKESEEILRSLGFACTMNCEERINKITRDPACLYGLGRYNRPSGLSTAKFMSRALGE